MAWNMVHLLKPDLFEYREMLSLLTALSLSPTDRCLFALRVSESTLPQYNPRPVPRFLHFCFKAEFMWTSAFIFLSFMVVFFGGIYYLLLHNFVFTMTTVLLYCTVHKSMRCS